MQHNILLLCCIYFYLKSTGYNKNNEAKRIMITRYPLLALLFPNKAEMIAVHNAVMTNISATSV